MLMYVEDELSAWLPECDNQDILDLLKYALVSKILVKIAPILTQNS